MASIGTATGHRRPTFGLPLRLLGDDRLARMAARGEQRAFEAVFARYHRELYRYCRAILGETEEANDALQSTMAVALHHLPRAERRRSLRGWLYRVAHNEAISILRRRTVPVDPLRLPEGIAPGADVRVEERERLRHLVGDLRALPERQRSALLMREMSGLSYAQIADALETSQGAARQLVYEARDSLRAAALVRGDAIEGVKARRADLSALFPPLAPTAASGALVSLLGGLGESGVGAGGAAMGGAGVKAASIACVLVLGAGAAGIGGGLKSPFGPGSAPATQAAAAPQHSANPNSATSAAGGRLGSAGPAREHARRPAQASSGAGRESSHRSGNEAAGSKSQGRAVRNHGQAAEKAQPVGPPATPPGTAQSSSAGGTPTPGASGDPAPAADTGLAQAATVQATSHGGSAMAPGEASVPTPRAGVKVEPPGQSSK